MSNAVITQTIDEAREAQRLDNFLIGRLKGVPKSRIYRAIRKGEVRINGKRVKAEYKLEVGDEVRIPPLRVASAGDQVPISQSLMTLIEASIIYEDDSVIFLNKPKGIAVHGGSGIPFGLIEILRASRPKAKFLDLAHRLDRDTSGCLVVAKKSSILKQLNLIFKEKSIGKKYLALVHGRCAFKKKIIDVPLHVGKLGSGERYVRTSKDGKSAVTTFRVLGFLKSCTLVEVTPLTGRTHQIRVHAKALGHPIVGDEKYGLAELDAQLFQSFPRRLYLHCASLVFQLPDQAGQYAIGAVLDANFLKVVNEVSAVNS